MNQLLLAAMRRIEAWLAAHPGCQVCCRCGSETDEPARWYAHTQRAGVEVYTASGATLQEAIVELAQIASEDQ